HPQGHRRPHRRRRHRRARRRHGPHRARATMIALVLTAQLTLGDAVTRALGQYPTVAAAHIAVDRARADVRDASSASRPRLALDATATQNQLPGLVYPLHGLPSVANPGAVPVFDRTLFQG